MTITREMLNQYDQENQTMSPDLFLAGSGNETSLFVVSFSWFAMMESGPALVGPAGPVQPALLSNRS